MKKSLLLISGLCFLVTACAGPITSAPQGSRESINREAQLQKELVYKNYTKDQDRVFNIAFPLRAGNANSCGDRTEPLHGMTAWNLDTVPPKYRQAAKTIYNLQDRLAIQSVADRSPASKAGIKSGDFITSINGVTITKGAGALDKAAKLFKNAKYNPSIITLERKGKAISTTIQPVKACSYPVILDYNSNKINAFADGSRIVISKGIVRFAQNDDELAMVIAHELAHNTLNHVGKLKQNSIIGSIGGLAVDSILAAAGVSSGSQFSRLGGQLGANQHAVAFEQEADYVGMYFLENSGYDSAGVAHFWRRMAADNPRGIYTRTSHPTTPERFVAIENTRNEIISKKKRGAKLVPNLAPK